MTTLPQPEHRADTPRRVIRALFEFRWSMIGFFVVFFALMMVIAYFFPPIWEAEAKVLVKAGRQNAPTSVPYPTATVPRLDVTMEDVVSEISIMLSEPVVHEVAERLRAQAPEEVKETFISRFKEGLNDFLVGIGLKPDIPEGANLEEQLKRKVVAEIEPGSNVIVLTYHHFGKQTAVKTINWLLEAYLDQHTKIHSDSRALEFFEEQVAAKKAELDEIERLLTEFRLSHEGGNLSQQRDLLVADLNEYRQDLKSLAGIDAGDTDSLLRATALSEHPELATYYQRLLDLELRITSAEGIRPDEVEIAREQFATTAAKLAEQIQNKRAYLARRVASLEEEIQRVEADRAYYDDLLSRRDTVKAAYLQYTAKAEEERINSAMDADKLASVRVLENAVEPLKPWFPNRFVMALLGILLGIPGAIAFALLRAYFHGRVATVQDIESGIGFPVLASLKQLPARAFAQGMPEPVMQGARLVLASVDQAGVKTVCLASSSRGEGAATMAAAVALAAATDGRAVVYATPDGEVSGAIRGDERIRVLDLSSMNLAEQKRAVEEAAAGCDLVVMAALPLAGPEGGMYAALAEAAVFVVSGSGVHIEVARRGGAVLRRYCDRILGAVLTQRRDPIPRPLYRRV
ncbi:MAG: hypothetical protein D6702_05295 [Planctomycetota bacterium]|nr:MAG: hypothetical protein D6702_05295 [Planctomycetota bacterium]